MNPARTAAIAPAGRPIRRVGPALGNHANSKVLRGTVHDPAQARRWSMQRAVQGIMAENGDGTRAMRGLAFRYRVVMCQRGHTGQETLKIKRNVDGTRAEYRGLQTCGSVWHCPICAPKIAATRVREMEIANAAHAAAGPGAIYFLTYTVQHDVKDSGAGMLQAQLDKLRPSLSRVKGSKAWREIMTRAGSVGSIRALEVTYGEMNGWHSHAHEIRFADRGGLVLDRKGFTVRWLSPLYALARLWCRELIKRDLAGLDPLDTPAERRGKLRALLRRALTIQDGTYAARYVQEFGQAPESGLWPAGELALSHVKTARRAGHCTPWGLLADALEGDGRSRHLFREYALAFHGVPQLYWSRGLKERFQIAERADDDLAAAADKECTQFVALVTWSEWALVLRYNARFQLLRVAAMDGALGVESYLRDLAECARGGGSPPQFAGDFTINTRGELFAATIEREAA